MNNIKLLYIILIFIVKTNIVYPQDLCNKYVIFTFEDSYKISQHGTKTYYWIVESDSVKSFNFNLSHLFIEGFSKNDLKDCMEGKPFDPFLVYKNSKYNFDQSYYNKLQNLKDILKDNKLLIQVTNKKWTSGQKEKILVYATPIYGSFCSSLFHPIGQERTGYNGKAYLPISDFKYMPEFWKSDKEKYIKKRDFSRIQFDIID